MLTLRGGGPTAAAPRPRLFSAPRETVLATPRLGFYANHAARLVKRTTRQRVAHVFAHVVLTQKLSANLILFAFHIFFSPFISKCYILHICILLWLAILFYSIVLV